MADEDPVLREQGGASASDPYLYPVGFDRFWKNGAAIAVRSGSPLLCLECPCVSGGACSGCCSSVVLPLTLTATITGCACFSGTVSLTYVSGTGWTGTADCGGNSVDLTLACSGSTVLDFFLSSTALGLFATASSGNCATFTVTLTGTTGTTVGTCTSGSSLTITVTGTPVTTAQCTACCANDAIPNTLYIAFSGSACCVFNGTTVTLTWDGSTKWVSGTQTPGDGHTYVFQIECTGSTANDLLLGITKDGFGPTTSAPTTTACSPFSFTYSSMVDCSTGPCSFGTMTVTS